MDNNDALGEGMVRCEVCGTAVPSYDAVHYGSIEGGYRMLCTLCFNAEVASAQGLECFENVRLNQIVMNDCDGVAHVFHFRPRLFGAMLALDAFELKGGGPGGYEFQIIGDAEGDILSLLGRLVERMRRRLAVKHLEQSAHGLRIAAQTVRGHISSDFAQDERTPLLVIDGREVSWEEFGHMLMTFEGWQFRMEIVDRSDEA